MTRRALLAMLALAVADPERLIWVSGRKLISIPAAPKATFLRVNPVHHWDCVQMYSIEILDQYGKTFSLHKCHRLPFFAYHDNTDTLQPWIGPSPPLPELRGLRLWPRESRRSSSATGRA